jgi:isocitrate dehydrogenase
MMLAHLGQNETADTIKNAWLRTIEDGYHTADIYQEGQSVKKVNTGEFADAVIERLGQTPQHLPLSTLASGSGEINIPDFIRHKENKTLVGVDLFIDWEGSDANEIGDNLSKVTGGNLKLKMITNRGVKVYPNGMPETYCTDHWRCRFVPHKDGQPVYETEAYASVLELLNNANAAGFDVVKTENLYHFDDQRGFSLGQGE